MKQFIEISEYDPAWPSEFDKEKHKIVHEIGGHITSIHHIGSTAIKGLRAKAIIDIAIEVKEYPPNQNIIESLERLGYVNMGEAGFEKRYWFKKGDPRKYHVHIVQENSGIITNLIAFRDILRTNKNIAKEYEILKLSEATGRALDNNNYAISKNSFVETVIRSANTALQRKPNSRRL